MHQQVQHSTTVRSAHTVVGFKRLITFKHKQSYYLRPVCEQACKVSSEQTCRFARMFVFPIHHTLSQKSEVEKDV